MEGVFDVYFELLRLVKVPNMINSKDIELIEKKVQDLAIIYRDVVPGPVTPKFHELEAHMVNFLSAFSCGWPYSEEGVESAHHWIRLFREKTSHVTGYRKKFLNFANMWVANQSESGTRELREVMAGGRKLAYAPRPNRKKQTIGELLVQF